MRSEVMLPPVEEEIERAVELSRAEKWQDALEVFGQLTHREIGEVEFPAEYYSYLGYGVARYQRRKREGVKLCEHAARLEPDNSAVLFNLARIHLLLRNRRRGVMALARGLKLHPENTLLQDLRRQVGVRRRPVVPFLGRDNALNLTLGQLRARWFDGAGLLEDDGLE